MTRRKAITILELLVVVAVIGALVGIVLPSLTAVRSRGASLRCQVNLRQWAFAVNLYALNYEGYLPRRGQGQQATSNIDRPDDWFNALPTFLGEDDYGSLAKNKRIPRPGNRSTWMCPAAVDVSGTNYFAYGMNMRLSTWQALYPDRMDAVASTQQQVFMSESPGQYCSILPTNKPYSPVARHDQAVNVAYLDGHVSHYSGLYVGCGVGDPLRPDVQWLVSNSTWAGPD